MDYIKKGISDIDCNRCNAGKMDDYGIAYKCSVCGQYYKPDVQKFSEEI